MRTLTSSRRSEDGAAAVEFAFIFAAVFVPLLMGMLQYGWYFYATQATTSGAREAARRLSVGDCKTGTAAQTHAQNVSGFKSLALDFGPTTAPSSNTLPPTGDVLRVEARVNGKIIGFLPMPSDGQITRVVEARVEDQLQDSPCP